MNTNQGWLARGVRFVSIGIKRRQKAGCLKVYCVGHDLSVLELRALVLESVGLDVHFGEPPAALEAISTTDFDAVVVSFDVGDEDRDLICRACTPHVRIVRLERFTTPKALIAAVKNVIRFPGSDAEREIAFPGVAG